MVRIMKNIISIILLLTFSLSFNVYASNSYIEEARILYDLGFYNGVSQSFFEPDLNSFVDTETAVVFLLRLVKSKSDIQSLSEYDVRNILNNYNDRSTVSDWARKYIAYGINQRILLDIQGNSISPKRLIDGKTFTAMLLKSMGYSLDSNMSTISAYINSYFGGIPPKEAKNLNDKVLNKNDMIEILWETLKVKTYDNTVLIDKIASNNQLQTERLVRLGFSYYNGHYQAPVFNTYTSNTDNNYTNSNSNSNSNQNQVLAMKDGSAYIGESFNGIPNGYGAVNYEDGSRYEGQVSGGIREGQGKLTRTDGFIYSGGWKNDSMNGKCNLQWPNGDNYDGEIVDGVFQGIGTMRWVSGDSYSGGWHKGLISGKGRFQWNNGNYYDGQWSNGEFNGYGTFYYSTGELYEGEWKNGKKNGNGKQVSADSTIKNGYWENDEFKY